MYDRRVIMAGGVAYSKWRFARVQPCVRANRPGVRRPCRSAPCRERQPVRAGIGPRPRACSRLRLDELVEVRCKWRRRQCGVETCDHCRGEPPVCTLAFRHIPDAPFVSGRAEQRRMRRNGHRHTLARLGWRKTAGAFAIGLAGVVAVTLVSLAFGSSRDASSGQTFWAVTTDSSLLRFVLGTSSVSVSVTDSCVAGELNSGTASLQDDHFLFKGGPTARRGGISTRSERA